jgi:hypothetical protein
MVDGLSEKRLDPRAAIARAPSKPRGHGEIGGVEGKLGRADFVDSAGIALPQLRKKTQQSSLGYPPRI